MKKKILLIADSPELLQLYQTAVASLLGKDIVVATKNHTGGTIECFCYTAPDIVMIFDFEPSSCPRQKNEGKETYELLKERCKACKCEIVLTSVHRENEFTEGELPKEVIYLPMPIKMEVWRERIKQLTVEL